MKLFYLCDICKKNQRPKFMTRQIKAFDAFPHKNSTMALSKTIPPTTRCAEVEGSFDDTFDSKVAVKHDETIAQIG